MMDKVIRGVDIQPDWLDEVVYFDANDKRKKTTMAGVELLTNAELCTVVVTTRGGDELRPWRGLWDF